MPTQTDTDAEFLATLPTTDASGRSFEWLALLGRGSFGEVYLAKMRSPSGLEQHVAVKLLYTDLDPRSQAIERLRDEARLLASLHHPVILVAHDLVEIGGRVALIAEHIEGEDLSACLQGEGQMPPCTVLEVVAAVADALDAAFRQHEVVHRDIKPSNIRIGVHGNVKLLDFGIARSGRPREANTHPLTRMGTQRYMAPERFSAAAEPAPSSDVFSLGAVLYRGVTGEPFLAKLDLAQQYRLSLAADQWSTLLDKRLDALHHAKHLPSGLQQLLREMLSHDEAARPTAGEVAERTEELSAQSVNHIRLSRWCRTRRWPVSPLSAPPAVSLTSRTTVRTPLPRRPISSQSSPSLTARLSEADAAQWRMNLGQWLAAAVAAGGGLLAVTAMLMLGFLIVFKLKAPQFSHQPPTYEVMLLSEPPGAEIVLTASGEILGETPRTVSLPGGPVAVQLRGPDGSATEQMLLIREDGPSRYVWDIASGHFEGAD